MHTLPDARVIEAGTATTSGNNTSVSLSGGFDNAPVILTSAMSQNDTTTLDSDPLNIARSGFTLWMQGEEGQADNHGSETAGFIAISPGGDVASGTADSFGILTHVSGTFTPGDTFDAALAETQTINGGNPGTIIIAAQSDSDLDLSFQEDDWVDADLNHIAETAGIVAFEDGLIPCFAPGAQIETVAVSRPVEQVSPRDLVLTGDHGPKPLRRPSRTVLGPERLRLRPALSLVNDRTIPRDTRATPVSHLHLLFDRDALITAVGAVSESLRAGQHDMAALHPAARGELLSLFHDPAALSGSFGPTACLAVRAREWWLLA